MDRWIVFVNTSTAEWSGSSEATYPVLAVDSKACATLVAARLNHLLGVSDETLGGDYSNFTFKAESALTPEEFAMALDLKDPAFPGNGPYPDWLVRTVTAARTATEEVRGGVVNRVDNLLRAVEMHRLVFLFFAAARRHNPNASGSRSGVNERVLRSEVRGWDAMLNAIDPDGEFLWAHRGVLDRYAQAALGEFGPGDGMQPTEVDENGHTIPIEGGTYPYWSLDDGSSKHLEETSDGILSACQALAEADRRESVPDLVRAAIAASRPEGHSRWNESVIVNWSYLSTLDALATRIKTVRAELALPPRSEEAPAPAPVGPTPDAQSVADLVVLLMVTRDLLRIRQEYPDAITKAAHKDWVNEIVTLANPILQSAGFAAVKDVIPTPPFVGSDDPEAFGILMSTVLLFHPSMAAATGTPSEIRAAVENAMRTCHETASPRVKEHMARLANVMVVSCRCPYGAVVKGVANPARFLQMLQRYWGLARTLVQIQSTSEMGFRPHPLLHWIENLRDRLHTCFGHLAEMEGASEAQEACDGLLGKLTDGDGGDMAAVPEWADGEVQNVERFIARSRLKLGPREFPLTTAEVFFIKQCEKLISDHAARVKAAWRKVVTQVDASAASRKATGTPQSPAAPSAVDKAAQSKAPNPRRVVLGPRGEPCTVDGKEKGPLTRHQYDLIEALLASGQSGMKLSELQHVCRSARKMLNKLKKDPDWARVISMAGVAGRGYRIR